MITVGIAVGVVAVVLLSWWGCRYFLARPQHGGSGEGALTVEYLVKRIDAETSGGRHQLREPITILGDLADALAVEETRLLPLASTGLPIGDQVALARHPGALRRVLVGLQNL
ncbi:hypothetical protein [Saccharopolyspora pogona]|uniref:hypothetical protein n=1 Tax=Saccharopolyspora pogona TaxID=333966 RepID=UPI001688F367|nr:hypothetical protein [Saccharopolyspora pogona]